jgi:hypothetical protein
MDGILVSVSTVSSIYVWMRTTVVFMGGVGTLLQLLLERAKDNAPHVFIVVLGNHDGPASERTK